ncbi:MAG: hypothetical protein IPM86_08275 [Saprospiraceae bacterium]|nr:hypothetical protein [Saprospiraceae bacterium]
MKHTTIWIAALMMLSTSCKLTRQIKARYSKKVYSHEYKIQDKNVVFLELWSTAKEEYYDDLRSKLVFYKSKSYEINGLRTCCPKSEDSIRIVTTKLKIRKLRGYARPIDPESDDIIFSNFVKRPSWDKLGLANKPNWWTYSLSDLMDKFEQTHGKVELEEMDLNTSFSTRYRGDKSRKKEFKSFFIDETNRELIKRIQESPSKNLLIMGTRFSHKDFEKKLLRIGEKK